MSTTDAARESARRRDGQFGPQARTELDPANAGLDVPEAPLPTWDEALAHAEVLREQGVKVSINEHWMSIEIFGTNGKYHDSADGTPAYQAFYPDGKPIWIGHWANGKRSDPADGAPARQWFYPDGTPEWISHWTKDYPQDPDDGTPALQKFYPDGTPKQIAHYANGKFVSRETFPPPTGEA